MYAVLELKYDKGKILLGKKKWILKQQKAYNKTEDVFSYWSPDLNDSVEDINGDYLKTFTGEPGLFKVFVIKLAGKSNRYDQLCFSKFFNFKNYSKYRRPSYVSFPC